MQGDKTRGEKAIAEGFAFKGDRPGNLGVYGSPMRDTALMIALTPEGGFAKPEYDARAVDLGREIDARRNRGWLYMSTQEQVALVRLGKALMAGQDKRVSGTWHVGDGEEAAAAAKLVGRMFAYDTLASEIGRAHV